MSSAIFGGLGSAGSIFLPAGSTQLGNAQAQAAAQQSGMSIQQSIYVPQGQVYMVSPHAQAQKAEEIIKTERDRLLGLFLKQTPAHREAYISAQRVIAVHEALYPNATGGLNHINSIMSTHSGYGKPDVKLTLRDLEEAHANALLEDVLQGAE